MQPKGATPLSCTLEELEEGCDRRRAIADTDRAAVPGVRVVELPGRECLVSQLLQARPPRVHVVRPRLGQRKRLRQCGGWRGLPRKVLPKRDLHLWPPLTEGIPLGCLPRGDGVGDCVQLCLGEQASRDRPCESGIKVVVECHAPRTRWRVGARHRASSARAWKSSASTDRLCTRQCSPPCSAFGSRGLERRTC